MKPLLFVCAIMFLVDVVVGGWDQIIDQASCWGKQVGVLAVDQVCMIRPPLQLEGRAQLPHSTDRNLCSTQLHRVV